MSMAVVSCAQYIEPTIRNAVKPMRELNWVILVERVLKLAIPTLYIWLVMFYTVRACSTLGTSAPEYDRAADEVCTLLCLLFRWQHHFICIFVASD